MPRQRQSSWRCLDAQRGILGPEHQDMLATMSDLATVLANERKGAEAERLYPELIRTATKANAGIQLGLSWYGLATMSAKAGRHDKALEYLSHAVDSGFGRPEWTAADSDLTSLHGDPRFDAIVAKARQTATMPQRGHCQRECKIPLISTKECFQLRLNTILLFATFLLVGIIYIIQQWRIAIGGVRFPETTTLKRRPRSEGGCQPCFVRREDKARCDILRYFRCSH